MIDKTDKTDESISESNGAIELNKETQKDLNELYRTREVIDMQINTTLRAIMNQCGGDDKKTKYQLTKDRTQLKPMVEKEEK